MENHKSVMHGAAFFYFRAERVGPKENFFEWGGAGQGVKSSGLCGVTVKFGVFSGRGRVALKIFRGRACIPAINPFSKLVINH